MLYVIKNSGHYRKDGVDQVHMTKKKAEQVARDLRFAGAKVWVEKLADDYVWEALR
jgi:hypothetical protein